MNFPPELGVNWPKNYQKDFFQNLKNCLEVSSNTIGIGVSLPSTEKDLKNSKENSVNIVEFIELVVPDVKFSSILNLPSQVFQKIIRDLSSISDKLEIKSVGNELIFKCSGQFASAEIHRAESDGSMGFVLKQDSSKVIQGEFSLKNLGYFIKCTNLCNNVLMFLKNDYPIIITYQILGIGEIKLILSPSKAD